MKKNILYIFDQCLTLPRLLDSSNLQQSRVLLVPLTTNEETISKVEVAFRSAAKVEFTKIPFVTNFNKKAFEIRDDFIRFIADFSRCKVDGKNLKEYFKYPSANFSTWWFSLVAEKNTLKNDSFHSLVKLLTLKELCEEYKCREVWLDIADEELTGAIKDNADSLGISCRDLNGHKNVSEFMSIFGAVIFALKYFLVQFARSILAKCYMAGLSGRKKILKECQYLLVTYFPYFDEQKLKEGKFVNKYYEPLQRALEQKCKDSFAWLAMTVGNSKYNWRENLAFCRHINKCGNPFMFCEEWLGALDWFKVFLLYIYFSIKYSFLFFWLPRNFKYPEGNLNIWRLFRDEWHSSFCGYVLIEGIIYYLIFKNVFNRLPDGAKVLYFAEMHSWEKALTAASSRSGKIKTVGIQHTIVPLMLLMYFNDRTELEDGDYIQTMPKPDYLACVGEIPAGLFRDAGWRKDRVFSWGTLRFQHFKHQLKHMVSWENRKSRVIIALSIMPEKSAETLLYIYQAFKNSTGFEVFIKGHPDFPIKKLTRVLGIEFNEPIFTFSDFSLEVLLRDAKAVVVTGSSASLEAIACGCSVIIPRLVNFIDMDPVSGISDLPIYVESPSELRDIVEKILIGKEPPFSISQCRDFILNYCNLLSSDEDFLKELEKASG